MGILKNNWDLLNKKDYFYLPHWRGRKRRRKRRKEE
jgi:hypothetical protein